MVGRTFDHERAPAVPGPAAVRPAAVPARPRAPPPLAAVIQRARVSPRSLTRTDVAQLHRSIGNAAVGRLLAGAAAPNRTGLPDGLKAGVEALSGLAMDDVRVHYDSPEPAAMQAHAYARGSEIHLGPGQERHLSHEAWHVVQQKQGRVRATTQVAGAAVNDDPSLEHDAEVNGARAASDGTFAPATTSISCPCRTATVQRFVDPEADEDRARAYLHDHGQLILSSYKQMIDALARESGSNMQLGQELIGFIDSIIEKIDEISLGSVKRAIKVLNRMEEDVSAFQVSSLSTQDVDRIALGTEFTFTCAQLQGTSTSDGNFSIQESLIVKWLSNFTYTPVRGKRDVLPHKGKYSKARKIVYTFSDGSTWYWIIDIDDGCLETQTKPSSRKGLGQANIRQIITDDIFKAAGEAELEPGGGGGHISLDASQLIGRSGLVLIYFVNKLERAAEEWDQQFGFEKPTESDLLNQPWLGELGALADFDKVCRVLLNQLEAGLIGYDGVVEVLQKFSLDIVNDYASAFLKRTQAEFDSTKKLKKGKSPDEKKDISERKKAAAKNLDQARNATDPSHRLHYRSINIEHLSDENQERRRIELRRIDAQGSLNELVEQVNFIFNMVNQSRSGVLKRLRQTSSRGSQNGTSGRQGGNTAGASSSTPPSLVKPGKMEEAPDDRDVMAHPEPGSTPISVGPRLVNLDGVGVGEMVSLAQIIRDSGFRAAGRIGVVSGQTWDCYIRCVLHGLEIYSDDIFLKIKLRVDSRMKSNADNGGVNIGGTREEEIQAIIQNECGKSYYVDVISLTGGMQDHSRITVGEKVRLIHTNLHFSVWWPEGEK